MVHEHEVEDSVDGCAIIEDDVSGKSILKTLQPLTKCDDSDSKSVEIIDFSMAFSPYKSHLAREISDELRHYERGRKRALALEKWKWEEVIALESSEDTDLEEELDDTATSTSPPRKIPKITIHKRHRVLLLRDESDDEDLSPKI